MSSNVRFEWDEAKNQANRKKHGLTFEQAGRVFADPLHFAVKDQIEGAEQRWRTIGAVGGFTIVVVAHTIGDLKDEHGAPYEVVRIISATRIERRRYEEG